MLNLWVHETKKMRTAGGNLECQSTSACATVWLLLKMGDETNAEGVCRDATADNNWQTFGADYGA